MAAIRALEQWCKTQCDGYSDVAITNMTTSFKNGLAFCALIHKYRPDLIDYDSLKEEDVFENNRLAFQVAEEKLGIPALLDAEDMVALRIPDRLSILTYVSQYYNYFKGRPPMGGVKRPAEGSKEEPSEKKNLPVVAKSFASKNGTSLPSTLTGQTAPAACGATAQTAVCAENANKHGTLHSKCVACRSHVHLVQRHLVDGKLYHRSCFKCSECSSVLHAGGFKPGKKPDTYICSAHQNGCKPSSSAAGIKNGPASSAARLNGAVGARPASRPPSVLSAPPDVVLKPAGPAPPSRAWTASAHRTQAARQRFFQAAAPATAASAGHGKSTEPSGAFGKVAQSADDWKSKARTTVGKALAEENRNNNNKRPFTVRSAESRFGVEPSSAVSAGLRGDERSRVPAGSRAGQPPNKEPACLNAVSRDGARPAAVHTNAKDPVWGQLKLKPMKPALNDAEAFTERHKSGFKSPTSSYVLDRTTGPRSAAAAPPVSVALFDPEISLQKPQRGSENLGIRHGSYSPVKSPNRRPAVESFSSTAAANHNQSGAKKGKYLSPTNASRTEMRSPSSLLSHVFYQVKSHHIPAEQIERDLADIETNMAHLEQEGVGLEKQLRRCEEEGEGDLLMDPLMVDWFNLIRKKQLYIRKESELVYTARTQELEQQQSAVEAELRGLLEEPDYLKSRDEQQREKKLMRRLMEIVDGRNAIVEGLDEDRLREVEEDQRLNEMMQNLGVKKAKHKRKSSISKLFRRRSKRRVE
uniref:MICAL-like protein 2a isoform X2 n=1 Tax=Gasterosteus aculeatus aculeatus TaxID=481459 RepID=UPI001A991453|nr:MICAL-like protein 2a isoform X2 [Gasterosteus aculeatus aculeatus]